MESRAAEASFLDALKRREARVQVARGSILLCELGLGRYARLQEARKTIRDESDPVVRARLVVEMVKIGAGDGFSMMDPEDIAPVLVGMVEVNTEPPLLAWQQNTGPAKEVEARDNTYYPGQELANIISVLAQAFHWSAEEIVEQLTYYQACCYVQEAMIAMHNDRAFQYSLTDAGMRKVGGEYVKDPYPELQWVKRIPTKRERQLRDMKLPAEFEPTGVIRDFSSYAKTGKVESYEIPPQAKAVISTDASGEKS